MLELDFSPWEDGPPIRDNCSQAEGLAYSEAVRQLQEKSQRGLSKDLVKQWGARFKDKVSLEGVVCRKDMNSVLELRTLRRPEDAMCLEGRYCWLPALPGIQTPVLKGREIRVTVDRSPFGSPRRRQLGPFSKVGQDKTSWRRSQVVCFRKNVTQGRQTAQTR